MSALISPAGSRVGVRSSRPGPQSTRFAGDPSGTAAGRAGSDRRTSLPMPPVAAAPQPATGGREVAA